MKLGIQPNDSSSYFDIRFSVALKLLCCVVLIGVVFVACHVASSVNDIFSGCLLTIVRILR